ncbi:hypothetical protein G6L34_16120 [Agrobacterium tumefaciens]|uniref:hypothetical protein n=1 Tax=Agrobacterium tumefaciens TaxID=358 RepID=UPI001571B9DB|nr:hypothetical protein [Agrobacterium tumefaciens]NTA49637.1 hypothetical protein [Agrobacterium tumefaciens]
MVWSIENNWRRLAQLQTSEEVTSSKFETETEIRLQLYAGTDKITLNEENQYYFGFKKMTLHIECDGTEIALGERFGDITPRDRDRQIVEEDVRSAGLKGNAGVNATLSSLPDISLKAEASAELGVSKEIRATEATTKQRRYVTARPNDEWEIACLDGKALNAKFITPDHVLCRVNPIPNRNRNGIQIHLTAHRHDLVIAEPRKLPWLNGENRTKEKIFKTLLGIEVAGKRKDLEPKLEIQLSFISSHTSDD